MNLRIYFIEERTGLHWCYSREVSNDFEFKAVAQFADRQTDESTKKQKQTKREKDQEDQEETDTADYWRVYYAVQRQHYNHSKQSRLPPEEEVGRRRKTEVIAALARLAVYLFIIVRAAPERGRCR